MTLSDFPADREADSRTRISLIDEQGQPIFGAIADSRSEPVTRILSAAELPRKLQLTSTGGDSTGAYSTIFR
jgi:hypothetical protein